MFPGQSSDTHTDPYNAPTSVTPTQPSASSPILSSGTSVSAETTSSLYLHQHPHFYHQFPHQNQEKQQQSLHSIQQQWPLATSYPSLDMVARDAERPVADQGILRQQYMQQQAAGSMSREEAQMILQQSISSNMQLQGLSMMPAVEQFYNEQLLRSFSSRSAPGSQLVGIDPRSPIYGSLQANQDLQMANQSSSSHVLSRTLENIGRSAEVAAAGVRYEETCTPRPRWCPTQEQIQILESLFNSGTTTPSRDMIVDIAAQLRKFGTIAEANVFYWFQNRKARAKRKLQPPAPPPPLNQPCVSAASDPERVDCVASESTHIVTTTSSSAAAGFEHAAQSKSRRMSLKHTSASSPSSSTSPDPHHVSGGPASPSPLQQQPIKPLLQQDTLIIPNRGVAATAGNPVQINQPSLYSWSHQQRLERLSAEEGQEAPATLPYNPQFLSSRRGGGPAEATHTEAFHHLLEYPRISLSLAPPTQHHGLQSSQVLGHTQAGVLGYSTQSDQQFLQATSKGIMLMDPQDSMGGSSCTSSTISSAFLSQVGASRHVTDIGTSQFSQVQSDQLPQSSLPLARPRDHQAAAAAVKAATTSVQADGDQEQLQMWEDLDSCNTLGAAWHAGQSHH